MKRLAGLALGGLPVWALAQQTAFPGTKKDLLVAPPQAGSGALGVLQLAQLLIALGIVFAVVKYLLPKFAAKMGRQLHTKLGSGIKIEESASFAGGMLYIVQARGRTLLIAVGAQGISCLADLTESPKTEEPFTTFKEMVEAQPEPAEGPFQPKTAVDEEDEEERPHANPAAEALEALRRLAK